MGSPSTYWTLIRLEASGKSKMQPIPSAQTLFQREFGSPSPQHQTDDVFIQNHLLSLYRTQNQPDAGLSLRCYISHHIETNCHRLETTYGYEHGFTRYQLYPLVLNDIIEIRPNVAPNPQTFHSLGQEILAKFDPSQARLSTWTARLVTSHPDVKTFLLEHGIYIVSDWAILNDTAPTQLPKILIEHHIQTTAELETATQLLQGYHAIYRQDRLEQRRQGAKGQCAQPTNAQLQQIAEWLQHNHQLRLSPEQVLSRLHRLADNLRQYRITARGGQPKGSIPIDTPETQDIIEREQLKNSPSEDTEADSLEQSFLKTYRQYFQQALDTAIAQVIEQRLAQLSRKKSSPSTSYLTGLHLFHCLGESMGKIASILGLEAQYQVSRLLKLKELRTDIRHAMLQSLQTEMRSQVQGYVEPERLQSMDQILEAALAEQVDVL